jgi:CheY-like chemotaxis protein
MDVQMPNLDGFAVTAVIREKEKSSGAHIPIIAMTAHALKGDEERCSPPAWTPRFLNRSTLQICLPPSTKFSTNAILPLRQTPPVPKRCTANPDRSPFDALTARR